MIFMDRMTDLNPMKRMTTEEAINMFRESSETENMNISKYL